MSKVSYSRAGDAAQPSPAIWGDCPKARLIDEGNGYYFHEEFLGGVATAAATAATPIGNGNLSFVGDTDTVLAFKAAEFGGYQDIETDGDDNDGAALFSEPMVQFVPNSGLKVWLEARLELGELADQGVFIGLVEEAGATQDVIADNAGALIGESLIGFQVLADDTDGIDAVAKLDAGTAISIKSVMNPTALVAATEFKVGLKFDGNDTIDVFFDGEKVGSYTIPSSGFPTAVPMCAIIAIKTGTGAARSIAIDWFRVAYQARI